MRRPLCVIALALLPASWAAFFFAGREALLLSLAAAVTGLLLLALRRRNLHAACAVLFAVALAFAGHARYEAKRIEPFLRAEKEVVAVEGIVTEFQRTSRSLICELSATFPERPDLPRSRLTLYLYGDTAFLPGEVLRCDVLLNPSAQPQSGRRLDAESFLAGSVVGEAELVQGGYFFRRRLVGLRQSLQNNVYLHLDGTSADVVSTMVLGARDSLDSDIYAVLGRAGTSHILSVSGLHLSILIAALLRLLDRLPLSRRAKSLLALLAASIFVLLIGLRASILRAFVMTAITLVAGMGRRRSDSLSSLAFAVILICLVRPDWVLGKGLWLSVSATLGILLYARPLEDWLRLRFGGDEELKNRMANAIFSALSVGVTAYAFTLPFQILFSGWIPFLSPISNLLTAPFVPPVILGGILCALFGTEALPLRIVAAVTDFCTSAVLAISELFSALPFATLSLDEGWAALWLFLLVAVFLLLFVFRADLRLAGYAATLLAFSLSVGLLSGAVADRGAIELATVEGCDAAVLLRGEEAVILGTPTYYEANQLMRYLEFRGVREIRAVVAADCGEQIGSGLLRLCARYPVDAVLGPDDAYILGQLAAALPDVPVYSVGYGTLTVLGGAVITVPEPANEMVVRLGREVILKSSEKYAIIESDPAYTIGLYPGGEMVLHGAGGLERSPIGGMIYGETRFRFPAG